MGGRLQKPVLVALAAAAAALLPQRVPAQVVEFAPALGMYYPVGGWTQTSDGGTGFAPVRRQLPAHMVSARLTAWPSHRFGLESSLSFTPSQVAISIDGNTRDIAGGVFLASARALFKVASFDTGARTQETWDIIVGAGGGLIHRGGSAWDNTTGNTVPAALVTLGLRLPFMGTATWRVALEDYISWTQLDAGTPSQTHARVHHDLVGSLSIAMRLGGR
jgi:hypothetical protein